MVNLLATFVDLAPEATHIRIDLAVAIVTHNARLIARLYRGGESLPDTTVNHTNLLGDLNLSLYWIQQKV
jgi:hypothetical protein